MSEFLARMALQGKKITNGMDVDIELMLGHTFDVIYGMEEGSSRIRFHKKDEFYFEMTHEQDCCEGVDINDICGDMEDLLNSPITMAECVINPDYAPTVHDEESYTWTFYKIGTCKGSVTIRWFGSSNGYYSESVDLTINVVGG